MHKIRKIMVGCDLSKYSKDVLIYAGELGKKFQGELIIVNVINKRDIDILLKVAQGQFDRNIEKYVEKSVEDYIERAKEQRSREIDTLTEETGCNKITIRKVFKVGIPFQELLRAIEEEGADLMVMGQKGSSDLADVLFGSNAEKLFRRCPIPMLSVRTGKPVQK